jgi:hypothetical protein
MKKALTRLLLVVFLIQIGYCTYRLPQYLLAEATFPDDMKLSLVIAGLCLGVLYALKGYTSPFE